MTPGASIVLRRNPNFWAQDLPALTGFYNVDEIRYEFYRDANSLFEAFKTELVDLRFEDEPARWVQGYDFPAVRDAQKCQGNHPHPALPAGMNGFVFNSRRAICGQAGQAGAHISLRFRMGERQPFFASIGAPPASSTFRTFPSSVGRHRRANGPVAPYHEEIPCGGARRKLATTR